MNRSIIFLLVIFLIYSCQLFDRHTVIEGKQSFQKKEDPEQIKKIIKGKQIYNKDCFMCHQKEKKGIDILKNINQRISNNYFSLYITKHDSLILSGDPYAREMSKKFNNAAAKHDYKYTENEMNCLIEYVMQ